LKLTRRGQYALKAVLDIAIYGDRPVSVSQIAHRQNIPAPFLEKILLDLKQAGILSAVRGAKGGYILRKPLKQITVGDILNAVHEQLEISTHNPDDWLDQVWYKKLDEKLQIAIASIPLSEIYFDYLSWQAQQSQDISLTI
jgi:Rrf2 family iron-sulfur cluster assembly transcriptional regulator